MTPPNGLAERLAELRELLAELAEAERAVREAVEIDAPLMGPALLLDAALSDLEAAAVNALPDLLTIAEAANEAAADSPKSSLKASLTLERLRYRLGQVGT